MFVYVSLWLLHAYACIALALYCLQAYTSKMQYYY